MQTFLPYDSFAKSAEVLDITRLRKQTIECKQIYNALCGSPRGNRDHCLYRTWDAVGVMLLRSYWWFMCEECKKRGISTGISKCFSETPMWTKLSDCGLVFPKDYHKRYKQHLLAKKYGHYRNFWPKETKRYGYWALNKEERWTLYSEYMNK